MNKVFQCPKCLNVFDKNNRIPLTLPCGHVLCKYCLSSESNHDKIKCSIDNNIYNGSVKTLPPCQTIIDHLPVHNIAEFVCKTHQDKTIKYYCSSCSLSICCKCISKHMSPHNVISFFPVKSSLLEEIDKIMESTVIKKSEIECKEKDLTNQLKKIDSSKNDNSNVLIEVIEALIATLNQIKHSINSIYLTKSLLQKDTITKALIKTEKDKQILNNLQASMNRFIQLLNSHQKLVYEDISKEKNNVIQQWETILKNSINDNLLIKQHSESIEIKPSNDRIILYKQFKAKLELFDQIFYRCESKLETSDVLLQSHISQKSTNNSTREITRKSLHKHLLYNSTKNISNISKKINNKSKCEDNHQSPLLYTENV